MSRLRLASLDEVPQGASVRVEQGGLRLAVFNTDSGVRVIDDRCSHAEASLSEGDVFGDEVECPRHGAIFDLITGDARSLPATRPVTSYAVAIEDGHITIDIPEEDA